MSTISGLLYFTHIYKHVWTKLNTCCLIITNHHITLSETVSALFASQVAGQQNFLTVSYTYSRASIIQRFEKSCDFRSSKKIEILSRRNVTVWRIVALIKCRKRESTLKLRRYLPVIHRRVSSSHRIHFCNKVFADLRAYSRIRKRGQLCPEKFLVHFPTGGLCRRINYNCAVFNPWLNELNLEYGRLSRPVWSYRKFRIKQS